MATNDPVILEFSAAEWAAYARKHFGPGSAPVAAFEPPRIDLADLGWTDPHQTEKGNFDPNPYTTGEGGL